MHSRAPGRGGFLPFRAGASSLPRQHDAMARGQRAARPPSLRRTCSNARTSSPPRDGASHFSMNGGLPKFESGVVATIGSGLVTLLWAGGQGRARATGNQGEFPGTFDGGRSRRSVRRGSAEDLTAQGSSSTARNKRRRGPAVGVNAFSTGLCTVPVGLLLRTRAATGAALLRAPGCGCVFGCRT